MEVAFVAAISGAAALPSSSAQNLLQNGGFKSPPVVGRTPVTAHGDPAAPQGATAWESLSGKRDETGGKLLVAITDEIARTGKQSL